jgi:hypothetical protein
MAYIKVILCCFLLYGCGPTILSVGILDVTAGDVVSSGVKYKLLEKE